MWYSQGTITATNNNTVITGVGTAFLQGVRWILMSYRIGLCSCVLMKLKRGMRS